jgi:hypothetical protein
VLSRGAVQGQKAVEGGRCCNHPAETPETGKLRKHIHVQKHWDAVILGAVFEEVSG